MMKTMVSKVKALMLVSMCLLLVFNTSVFAVGTAVQEEAQQLNRFEDLLNSLDNNTETSISIWTEDVDHDMVEEVVYAKTGLRPEDITDELDIDTVQNYIRTKRAVYKILFDQVNGELTTSLIKKNGGEVTFQSSYSPLIIFDATKSEAEKILSSSKILRAEEHLEYEIEDFSDVANVNNGAVYMKGNGINAKGAGVVIGQIEEGHPNASFAFEGQEYYDAGNITVLNNGTIHITPHASLVSAIMVGQPVTYNGVAYEGIAPEAELISVALGETAVLDEYMISVEELVERGVNIINSSCGHRLIDNEGGSTQSDMYTSYSMWIDYIVKNSGIHFVSAAGNLFAEEGSIPELAYYVSIQAHAYNGIAVGNVVDNNTIIGSHAPSTLSQQILNSNFTISPTNSYLTTRSRYYKPDLMAWGGNIAYGIFGAMSGTSFAAPQVTGIIAQLCSKYSSLMNDPLKVKSMLAATAIYRASDTATSDTKDPGSELFLKQGAGIVNARAAYNCYYAGKNHSCQIAGNTTTYTFTINVPSSYSYLRMAMTWFKNAQQESFSNGDNYYTEMPLVNYDLHIYYGSQCVAASENMGTNLEVLQFPVTQGGTYTVKIINRTWENEGVNYGTQFLNVSWY